MKRNKEEKIRIGKIKYCKEGNDYDIDKTVCKEDVVYCGLGRF